MIHSFSYLLEVLTRQVVRKPIIYEPSIADINLMVNYLKIIEISY